VTPKQQAFVTEYLRDKNGTQAAIRAGYSKKTARAIASELLTKPDIAAAVQAVQQQVATDAGITAAWVLEQQKQLAIQTKTTNEEVSRKCLRDIGEHLGMYVERVESTNTNVSYVVESPPKFTCPSTWQQQYSH
jgi:phage terminase small subunit